MWVKKTRQHSVVRKFAKCLMIFKILGLSHSAVNLQQSRVKTFYHTLVMSLHYLVKYLCSKNRYAQWVSAAKCRVSLSHSENCFKIFVWWNKEYLVPWQKNVHISLIKKCKLTQLLQQRKRCDSKMPYVISSRSVTDGVMQSVSQYIPKSKLVYRSLISVANKIKLFSMLI